MLIIGTVIGAGFASGQEIVAFFGAAYISPLVAAVCGALIAAGSYLFLYLGAKFGARNVSELNVKVLGRLHPAADVFLLFNSLIVLAGMLAGLDALGGMFFPLRPLYSIAGGALCGLVVCKGLNGLMRCNSLLIPAVIGIIVAVCAASLGPPLAEPALRFNPFSCVTYASMNLILAGTVLATVGVGKKRAVICSVAAGAVMGVLLLLILFALNANGAEGEMPLVSMARKYPPLFYTMAGVVAAAIFTTMLTAASGLSDWLTAATGSRRFSVAAVMLAGLILSNLGFETVVGLLYPVIGVLGALYLVLALIAAVRRGRPAAVTRRGDGGSASRRWRRRGTSAPRARTVSPSRSSRDRA